MSKIYNGLAAIKSLTNVVIRRLRGINIIASKVTLISSKATIKTSGKASEIRIGFRSAVRPNTELSSTNGVLIIGEKCFVNRNCIIASHEQIVIGDNVTIGPGTYIYDHDHNGSGGFNTEPVRIEDNVWIGAGCIILKGVTIGHNSVIAAGTVLTKEVPVNTMVIQKRYTEYIERI